MKPFQVMRFASVTGGGGDPTAESIYDALLEWWPFDETSGTTATGAVASTVLTESGSGISKDTSVKKVGAAALRAVPGGGISSVASDTFLTFGDTDFSFAFWVQKNGNSAETAGRIIAKYWDSGPQYLISINDANAFLFFAAEGVLGTSRVASTPSSTIVNDTWHFCRVWHDAAANEMGVQIDLGTKYTTTITGGITQPLVKAKFSVMNRNGSSTSTYDGASMYNGRQDELLVVNKVLSDAEASYLYNAGAGISFAALAAAAGH